ncbi:MAG: beta-propeller fold lactonase family protein, partial [Verrucomicrobiota bacterium]
VDPATGTLTRLQHQPVGTTPRQFAIDPTGQWCLVANQDSNNVLLYSIDPVTGLLTVKSTVLTLSKPVCILPFFITPPQPAVGMSDNGDGTLQLNLQNAFSSLTYEVHRAPALSAAPEWNLLATGIRGQTNFVLTNDWILAFFRAAVVTNY